MTSDTDSDGEYDGGAKVKTNKWLEFLNQYRKAHPELKSSAVMSLAAKEYNSLKKEKKPKKDKKSKKDKKKSKKGGDIDDSNQDGATIKPLSEVAPEAVLEKMKIDEAIKASADDDLSNADKETEHNALRSLIKKLAKSDNVQVRKYLHRMASYGKAHAENPWLEPVVAAGLKADDRSRNACEGWVKRYKHLHKYKKAIEQAKKCKIGGNNFTREELIAKLL